LTTSKETINREDGTNKNIAEVLKLSNSGRPDERINSPAVGRMRRNCFKVFRQYD
jgi:hypothetical protein